MTLHFCLHSKKSTTSPIINSNPSPLQWPVKILNLTMMRGLAIRKAHMKPTRVLKWYKISVWRHYSVMAYFKAIKPLANCQILSYKTIWLLDLDVGINVSFNLRHLITVHINEKKKKFPLVFFNLFLWWIRWHGIYFLYKIKNIFLLYCISLKKSIVIFTLKKYAAALQIAGMTLWEGSVRCNGFRSLGVSIKESQRNAEIKYTIPTLKY